MIALTDSAKKHALRLFESKEGDGNFLRVSVKGGGCSGMSYAVDIDNKIGEWDKVFGDDEVKVVCDQKSFVYLKGITIDYSDALVGGGFNFKNPNASGSCGCGISFSV